MLNQLLQKFVCISKIYFPLLNNEFVPLAADATCQFTLILTGTKIGQAKLELPFKLDGVDDYGYLHVEAEIIVRKNVFPFVKI
jgi:hypothetical protein